MDIETEIETGVVSNSEKQTGTCQFENITYKIVCQTCKNMKKDAHYIGETSRTAYVRGIEHQRDRVKMIEDSVLNKHDQNQHPGLAGGASYYMVVLNRHMRPLQRQVDESVKIECS